MPFLLDAEPSLSPIVGLRDEYSPGFVDPKHSHARDQLLYASTGVMSVRTDDANYVIPPQRAIWIPAFVEHEVSCRGHTSIRTLYLTERLAFADRRACRVIEVGELLKALIVEAASLGKSYALTERNEHLLALLLAELSAATSAPYHVPMPRDERLLRVCAAIIADPAGHHDLDCLADLAHMGRRTFTRTFRHETGMSLATWRQQVRLMHALTLLGEGRSVTTVAFDVGYDSPSAFTAVFHRAFGVPPSRHQIR